jgi:adenine-specific DNA-methyltransferase
MSEDRLPLTSQDIQAERLAALQELFPEVFAEGKIDFERLKQALGESVDEGRERYGLSWAGKSEAIRNLQAQSMGTLNPVPEESVNFETTENLFIEGDNLEVLKLLQKSYYNQIKMIYIDPPYNTGKEFIYPDNFREGLEDYLRYSGQKNSDGIKLTTNTETDGRFHSKWLNMIYPRLFIARSLLKEDGVIFISIDDNEAYNLRLLLNEIFGEENFLGIIVWEGATDNNPTQIAVEHEYILCFAKNKSNITSAWKNQSSASKSVMLAEYQRLKKLLKNNVESIQKEFRKFIRRNQASLNPITHYNQVDDRGIYTGSRKVHNPKAGGYIYDVIHPVTEKVCVPPVNGYRYPEDRMRKLIAEGRILFGKDENQVIQIKEYLEDYESKLSSVIEIDSRAGSNELKSLFPSDRKVFLNPKPVVLLRDLLEFCTGTEDLILDFFSGSCTTAQAVLELNHDDSGNRHFVMVQLPEPTENPEFTTIADIGKERIRRAINKINAEENGKLDLNGLGQQDRGFKVFKLTESNFKIWDGTAPQNAEQLSLMLEEFAANIRPGATKLGMLYEILLKAGFPLTAKIEKLDIAGQEIYAIEDQESFICLENEILEETIGQILAYQPQPKQFISLDSSFRGNDQLKTNTQLQMRDRNIKFKTV